MKLVLYPPARFEREYGPSRAVNRFFRYIKEAFEPEEISPLFQRVDVIFYIAPEEEYNEGKCREFQSFEWEYGLVTISARENYLNYLCSDDKEQVTIIYNMLLSVCNRLAKKKGAKFDGPKMKSIIEATYHQYMKDMEAKR